jgi:hypothetical protein
MENWNLDRTVEPAVMVRGQLVKTSAGVWETQEPVITTEQFNSLIGTLQELVQRLAPLGGAIAAGGSYLRVTQTAVPSTAVTGPITNAQYIATPAPGGINYPPKVAAENANAVLSNINNVVIT